MTRRQVASLFGVTSAAVAIWARRGRLPVETLFRSGLRRRTR